MQHDLYLQSYKVIKVKCKNADKFKVRFYTDREATHWAKNSETQPFRWDTEQMARVFANLYMRGYNEAYFPAK